MDSCLVAKPCFLVFSADRLGGVNTGFSICFLAYSLKIDTLESLIVLFSPHKTYQVSRLKRDCHACGLKTSVSRLLTAVFQFLTPGKNV